MSRHVVYAAVAIGAYIWTEYLLRFNPGVQSLIIEKNEKFLHSFNSEIPLIHNTFLNNEEERCIKDINKIQTMYNWLWIRYLYFA